MDGSPELATPNLTSSSFGSRVASIVTAALASAVPSGSKANLSRNQKFKSPNSMMSKKTTKSNRRAHIPAKFDPFEAPIAFLTRPTSPSLTVYTANQIANKLVSQTSKLHESEAPTFHLADGFASLAASWTRVALVAPSARKVTAVPGANSAGSTPITSLRWHQDAIQIQNQK